MSQPSARMTLYRDDAIGVVDPRLYGAFVEHVGRAIYGGIYEPGHPEADEYGYRKDVLNLVRELRVPLIRYPGGNFVSGYRWEDGVGPRENRPVRPDLAWRSLETNEIGVDEFARWAELAGSRLMMALNLGTRNVEAACNLLEYCNMETGTRYSDMRRSYGWAAPHNIPIWCLGNEMDGPWQIGHKTATEYGRLALETARAMRRLDSSVELVACGSSYPQMPTFPEWEAEVLQHTYDEVDYLSLHQYFVKKEIDTADYLAQTLEMDQYIQTVISTCDYVKAVKRSKKTMFLSFDEWNVWYHSNGRDDNLMREHPWRRAPDLLEEAFNMEDALVVGGILITLLHHVDRIKIACMAQLVNAIAPIMTVTGGPSWRQTTFYPFQLTSLYGRGVSLRPHMISSRYDSKNYTDVPYISAAAVYNEEVDTLTLFVLNRHLTEDVTFTADLHGFEGRRILSHTMLRHDDLNVCNRPSSEAVAPTDGGNTSISGSTFTSLLPRASWHVIRMGGA